MNKDVKTAFSVVPLEGRGLGAIAKRDILVGDLLMREQPLLRLTPDGLGRYDAHYYGGRESARAGLATLAQDVCGVRGDAADALTRAIETNGIVINHESEERFSVVFLTISRLNHSCRPNCEFHWDNDREEGCIKVVEPISSGSECTFNYGAVHASYKARQKYLKQRFGFLCDCDLCVQQEAYPAPPIPALPSRWQQWHALRSDLAPKQSKRAMCDGCLRPERVCVCDSLPRPPILPSTPVLVLQHKREAERKLNSGALLQLSVDPKRLTLVVGRSLLTARKSIVWESYVSHGRTPLLLFPRLSL